MQSVGRKRVVTSCIPCYMRKQKCNRRYPCNHCTRRRRPEECAYYPSQALQVPIPPLQTEDRRNEDRRIEDRRNEDLPANHDAQLQYASGNEPVGALSDWNTRRNSTLNQGSDSLAELFGYFEDSESNTMALVRRLGLDEDENQHGNNQTIPPDASEEVQKNIGRMPDRQIFDFLIQYYVTEVHWMEQLVYPPWFLAQYQQWWSLGRLSSVFDVEFTVLFLRVCSYALQFLPSPSYTIDRIRGMFLANIRDACDDIAEKLAVICARLNTKGSLLRVQHLSFSGLRSQCEGRINAFWEALSSAIRVAQRVGLHRGRTASMLGMHELEKEMRRRVFCNLYIWDSLLSRQLDRTPFLPDCLSPENLPRMHLAPNIDDADAPEGYSERLIQARLANFWRSFTPGQGAEYDEAAAEERYEKFCTDFLATLPPVFALKPSEEWDERLQILPLRRQILHITIFDCLCYNFRPVLLRGPNHVQSLPTYKQVLLSSQRKALAVAALKVLDGVSNLHVLLGGSYTRFAGIIFPTFEAAVLLVGLCMDVDFPGQCEDGPPSTLDIDPLGSGKSHVTRGRCRQAVHDALTRLRTLAEVSNMAKVGARTLARLLGNAPNLHLPSAEIVPVGSIQRLKPSSDAAQWLSFEASDPSALNDYFLSPSEETYPS
ncbi:hypothetical protein K432DRAFT_386876 [Lepidopterella palustris CBS 459.81]|uniref:Zn(2)-C6 fungal-type domain-containing protein n=1 Tax=Lepidopterella palustris CBS 459.81 TaxID=1314670 RepID=A0A8E2DZ00_9PEZI|nr:hypothetical protein K432DRAFT_386876 [Lepidopterella palustris CBS 459.81]